MLPSDMQTLDPKMVTHKYCLELIRSTSLDIDRLIYLANFLTSENWINVCEERSCDQVCGWPLCRESTEWTNSKPKLVLQPTSKNQVQLLDKTELYWYCGTSHMELSKQVESSLLAEPWWMRVARQRPIDLEWLRILIGLYDPTGDMDVEDDEAPADGSNSSMSTLSKQVANLDAFSIVERHDGERIEHKSPLHPSTSHQPGSSDPMTSSAAMLTDFISKVTIADEVQGQDNRKKVTFADNADVMDFSDDQEETSEEEDDGDIFDMNFKKHPLKFERSSEMTITNMLVHWTTWTTQKFCSIKDYQPHLHQASLHVAAQHDMDVTENVDYEPEDQQRRLPPVDGQNIEFNKRQTVSKLLSARLASLCASIPAIDKHSVTRTLDVLLSTFDYSTQTEALKTFEWNIVTVALLVAISSRHPGLRDIIYANQQVLQESFTVNLKFITELQGIFYHHG